MRKFICGSVLVISAGIVSGCASSSSKSDAPAVAVTKADKAVAGQTCLMQSGGRDVLKLTLGGDVTYKGTDGMLKIKGPVFDNEIWVVPDAKTIDDGITAIDKQIVGEFKDFKATETKDLTVAGSPAKQMFGTGHEADDGDAGHADIIVFKAGDHVFIACAHDENLTSLSRAGLVTVVTTAEKP